MPASDLTTPLSAIWSMARQRLPVLQPDPTMAWFTTGLTNGSRRLAKLTGLAGGAGASGPPWFSTPNCGLLFRGLLTATTVIFDFDLPADCFLDTGADVAFAFRATNGPLEPLCTAAEWLPLAWADAPCDALPCEAASAALESSCFLSWTFFIVSRVFWMASGFCPQAAAAIPMIRIPVVIPDVSFIDLPTSGPRRARSVPCHD